MEDEAPHDYLRRLPKGWYTGRAWVHWSMTIEGRKQGWLDNSFHARTREILLHTASRHHLVCPAYCLMPDHAHFLWMGIAQDSDLLAAAAFFRRHLNQALRESNVCFQKQAYDHVLNEDERNPDAFEDTVIYILKNPERAGLVEAWRDWPHLGASAVGYPDTDPRGKDWRERFWKIHHKEVGRFK
jgi:REP element-mobilizing transposase RayT